MISRDYRRDSTPFTFCEDVAIVVSSTPEQIRLQLFQGGTRPYIQAGVRPRQYGWHRLLMRRWNGEIGTASEHSLEANQGARDSVQKTLRSTGCLKGFPEPCPLAWKPALCPHRHKSCKRLQLGLSTSCCVKLSVLLDRFLLCRGPAGDVPSAVVHGSLSETGPRLCDALTWPWTRRVTKKLGSSTEATKTQMSAAHGQLMIGNPPRPDRARHRLGVDDGTTWSGNDRCKYPATSCDPVGPRARSREFRRQADRTRLRGDDTGAANHMAASDEPETDLR